MEFKEKLKQLRKQNNLTQEELALQLFITRTAVSKWESGKGFPNIESLKCISKLFKISVDDLLSADELMTFAESENRTNIEKINGLIYGILDLMSLLFLFLPLYGQKNGEVIRSVPLFEYHDITQITRLSYIIVLILMATLGLIEIITHFTENRKIKSLIRNSSVLIHTLTILVFVLSQQPYVSLFLFLFLMLKIALILKRK